MGLLKLLLIKRTLELYNNDYTAFTLVIEVDYKSELEECAKFLLQNDVSFRVSNENRLTVYFGR